MMANFLSALAKHINSSQAFFDITKVFRSVSMLCRLLKDCYSSNNLFLIHFAYNLKMQTDIF